MRSKSSAEGEVAVVWAGPELRVDGGLEKALQSPNSPFPLVDTAAEQSRPVIGVERIITSEVQTKDSKRSNVQLREFTRNKHGGSALQPHVNYGVIFAPQP